LQKEPLSRHPESPTTPMILKISQSKSQEIPRRIRLIISP
jgi:hypothetical protein